MLRGVSVTVLSENSVQCAGLVAEHGISYWVECGRCRVLFDTGQGMALAKNARALKVNLARASAIVLSHGHYDHVGGLEYAVRQSRGPVFLHPWALKRKFSRQQNGKMKKVSVSFLDAGGRVRLGKRLRLTVFPTEVVPGVFVTGGIPRRTRFEDVGGAFFLDAGGRVRDFVEDDQALFFDTVKGVVVLLGCAHAGVINTLLYVRQITGRPIYAVVGGMHLGSASTARLGRTMQALKQLRVQKIVPAHCTGANACAVLRQAFPRHFFSCSAGTRMVF